MAKNIELYIDHSEFDLLLKGNKYHIHYDLVILSRLYMYLSPCLIKILFFQII